MVPTLNSRPDEVRCKERDPRLCIGQWLPPARVAAMDIVHELPNLYDRLKLEIVGSCFALRPAKTPDIQDRGAYFLMVLLS